MEELSPPAAINIWVGEGDPPWLRRQGRVLLLIVGVFAPLMWLAAFSQSTPRSQLLASTQPSFTPELLLTNVGVGPFYPLLIPSMVALVCLLFSTERSMYNRWIRYAIYSGAALSLQYWVIVAILEGSLQIVALAFGLPISFIAFLGFNSLELSLAWNKPNPFWRIVAMVAVVVLLVICSPCLIAMGVMASMAMCTTWAVAIYGGASLWLMDRARGRQETFSLQSLFIFIAWCAAYFTAWRAALDRIAAG